MSQERFLEYLKESTFARDADKNIARRYLLDNLKYWLFATKTKSLCKEHDFVNILYFFSEDHCPSCPNQGVLLTYFKKIFEDRLLIFPVNVDLEPNERMIKILRTRYNITSYPSIVIDSERFEGIVPRNKLYAEICSKFRQVPPECET